MLASCPSLQYRPQAIVLGSVFARSFTARSAGLGKNEIPLFRAMQESLAAIANPPDVVVEEYHGADHQVTFTGTGSYSRTNSRCELSDLLVIVFDRLTKDARLTYIQAKSERSVPVSPVGVAGAHLIANLEQWDLLARRPLIAPVPSTWRSPRTFNPPADLLSGALLSSVGSFTFFLHGPGNVEIYYAAASSLAMPRLYSKRLGKLTAVPDVCQCGVYPECLSVYGNAAFAAFLFGLMIGTPILASGKVVNPSSNVNRWLGAQLRGFAAQQAALQANPGDLASEVARLLDPETNDVASSPNVGAASLFIFRVGTEPERRRD